MLRCARLALSSEPALARVGWSSLNASSLRRQYASEPDSRVIEATTDKEYDKLIADAKGLVITDFTAQWCGPCKRIAPIFSMMATENLDVAFVKVDIDVEALQKTVYAAGVSAVPTFTFTHKGKKLAEIRGADVAGLKATLDDLKKEIA